VAPPNNPWDVAIGPFFEAETLARRLGVTESELDRLVSENQVICLTTDDGASIYPTFQVEDARLIPGLPEIWQTLGHAYDALDAALWLNSPLEEWSGRTAAQMLRTGGDDARAAVLEAEENVGRMLT
jgi:hypothetical protein